AERDRPRRGPGAGGLRCVEGRGRAGPRGVPAAPVPGSAGNVRVALGPARAVISAGAWPSQPRRVAPHADLLGDAPQVVAGEAGGLGQLPHQGVDHRGHGLTRHLARDAVNRAEQRLIVVHPRLLVEPSDLPGTPYEGAPTVLPLPLQRVPYRVADLPETAELFGCERVEQGPAHLLDVAGRGRLQRGEAVVGEHRDVAAPVFRAALAADPAALLQPGHRV